MLKNLRQVKVATVMDAFSEQCYAPECDLLQLSIDDWLDEIVEFSPDFLLIESAWRGKDNQWRNRINAPFDEIRGVISYCKDNGIPTVLWNKEDPPNYERYINIAWMFDYIFTTDIDSIPRYMRDTGNQNVHFLHFAAQPRIHNPIEKYVRKNKFCFAGSYYKKYPQREIDFKSMVEAILEYSSIDIYDRNYGNNNPTLMFPDEYKKYILGSLLPEEIDLAYKGYYYNVNMNSVKESSTMFARRVYELMASNTVVFSNASNGLKTIFGDYIIASDDKDILSQKLELICNDITLYKKYRLIGLRNVLSQHLYEDRLARIVDVVLGEKLYYQQPSIKLFSVVNSNEELEYVLGRFDAQTYKKKTLIIVIDKIVSDNMVVRDDVIVLPDNVSLEEYINNLDGDEYIGFIRPDDYYGKNYVLDMMLTERYADAECFTKAAHYYFVGNAFVLQDGDLEYRFTDKASIYSSIFKKKYYHGNDCLNMTAISIDAFNYCVGFKGDCCPEVDDMDDEYEFVDINSLEKTECKPLSDNKEIIDLKLTDMFNSADKKMSAAYKNDINDIIIYSVPAKVKEKYSSEFIPIDNNMEYCVNISGSFEGKVINRCHFYDINNRLLSEQTSKNDENMLLNIPCDACKLKLEMCLCTRGKSYIHKYEIVKYKK